MWILSNLLPLLLLAACQLPSALAQTDEAERQNASGGVLRADQACYDVRPYDLALAIDPVSQSIEGRLVMTADVTA